MSKSKHSRSEAESQQDRRRRQISNRREEVTDARSYLSEAKLQYHISDDDAQHMLRQAVENYLLELEQVIKLSDTETDYWDGVHLGAVQLPDGSVKTFEGLRSIIECPNPMVVEWTEYSQSLVGGDDATQHRREINIPERVLLAAYRTANAFVAEYGLELDQQKQKAEAVGKYEDIHLTGPPKGDPAHNGGGDD